MTSVWDGAPCASLPITYLVREVRDEAPDMREDYCRQDRVPRVVLRRIAFDVPLDQSVGILHRELHVPGRGCFVRSACVLVCRGRNEKSTAFGKPAVHLKATLTRAFRVATFSTNVACLPSSREARIVLHFRSRDVSKYCRPRPGEASSRHLQDTRRHQHRLPFPIFSFRKVLKGFKTLRSPFERTKVSKLFLPTHLVAGAGLRHRWKGRFGGRSSGIGTSVGGAT